MRHFLIVSFLFFSSVIINAQEKRALLIGIGNYPKEYGWSMIHGQNDIEIIQPTLNALDFQNIIVLRDSDATYSNIMAEFQSLLDASNKNDIVYIHFSGHGQRITDLDGDEADKYDEAWIPYDAQISYCKGVYEGERHITDDFLNDYLTKLRIKVGPSGKIVVIADACHSGGGSRSVSDDEVFQRGVSSNFVIPKKTDNVLRKANPVDWLFVAACKSHQNNYEYKDEHGVYYGSLSYSIFKSQNKLKDIKHKDAVVLWSALMKKLTIYRQDMETEGMPSKMNSNLF